MQPVDPRTPTRTRGKNNRQTGAGTLTHDMRELIERPDRRVESPTVWPLPSYRFGESSGSVTPVTYEKCGSAYAADPKKLAVAVS